VRMTPSARAKYEAEGAPPGSATSRPPTR
jgi:hypothetical protein